VVQYEGTGDLKTYWMCLKKLWTTSDRRVAVVVAFFCLCTGVDHNLTVFSCAQLAVTDFVGFEVLQI
jgi:hypothetical protein